MTVWFFISFFFLLCPLEGCSRNLPKSVSLCDEVDKECRGAGKLTSQSMFCIPSLILPGLKYCNVI